MLRPILVALATGAALFGATAAQAGTHWSIGVGINLPAPAVVVADNVGYAEPAPVYYAPPPPVVTYVPAPRYVYRDAYYAPAPQVVYEPAYRGRRWGDRDDDWQWRRQHERHEHWDRDRDDYGPRRGR
jgi:hypothetical protein